MNFKYVTELVQEVVKEHPEAIDNKKILVTKVWEKQGLYLSDEQIELLFKVSTPETVTRCLRKLIETGEVKTSMEQHNASVKKEEAFREHFTSKPKYEFVGDKAYII